MFNQTIKTEKKSFLSLPLECPRLAGAGPFLGDIPVAGRPRSGGGEGSGKTIKLVKTNIRCIEQKHAASFAFKTRAAG